jgi:hypothetical protein
MHRTVLGHQVRAHRTSNTLQGRRGRAVVVIRMLRISSGGCECHGAYPGLDCGAFVRQETEVEVPRFPAVESEPVGALGRVGLHEVLQEQVFGELERTTRQRKARLTELVFGARLELLMCHQFLHSSSDGLDMIDDQLVEIGVFFAAFDEEPIAKALARDVCVRLSYICGWCTLSATRTR